MDLANLDTVKGADDGFEVKILHPVTQLPLGIVISVYGRDGRIFNETQSMQSRRRAAKAEASGRMDMLTKEEVEREAIELMAACTFAWRDDNDKLATAITVDKKALEFSRDNALAVYARFPWLKEQVDIGISKRANFIRV